MAIYILEDQFIQADALKKILMDLLRKKRIFDEKCTVFYSPMEMQEVIEYGNGPNIYYLDIQIKKNKIAGLELAKHIRTLDKDSLIVFITTHSELVLTSYQYLVSALSFIEKSTDIQTFIDNLELTLNEYLIKGNLEMPHDDLFQIKTKNFEMTIRLQDIYYFQTSYDHHINLVGKNNQFKEFYGRLNDIEGQNDLLIRIHQSFIVNILNITEIDKAKHEVNLGGNIKLPISRKYYKNFMEKYHEKIKS